MESYPLIFFTDIRCEESAVPADNGPYQVDLLWGPVLVRVDEVFVRDIVFRSPTP